jgi:hypothetical protein
MQKQDRFHAKSIIIITILIVQSLISYGQDFSFSLIPTVNSASYLRLVDGGVVTVREPGCIVSFEYELGNSNRITYGVGLSYQFSQVTLKAQKIPGYENPLSHKEKVNLLLFSLKSVYNMRNDYYLSFDPFVGIQLESDSQKTIDDQTGLGLSLGIGKKIDIGEPFYLKIEPRLGISNIVPFRKENLPLRVIACGLKLGVGIRNKRLSDKWTTPDY